MAWRPTALAGGWLWLLAGPAAHGQGPPPAPPLVATMTRAGAIEQILVDAHGDPDGLLLRDHTLVRFRPDRLDRRQRLRVGQEVRVEGEPATTPSGLSLFAARVRSGGLVVVGDAATGAPRRPPAAGPDDDLRPVTPRRPPAAGPDDDLRPVTARGRVRLWLTNPDGVIDGLLLDDGTVVQAGPEAHLSRLAIVPGTMLTVTGLGGSYPEGRSLRALTLRVGDGAVYSIGRRPPPLPRP